MKECVSSSTWKIPRRPSSPPDAFQRQPELFPLLRVLAHGNGHNTPQRPRLAQYITMSPAREKRREERENRVRAWRERRSMAGWPGDPRDWEHVHQEPAVLTELGRKLLGVDSWESPVIIV